MAIDTKPRHPLTKQFVPDPHSTGRALVARHLKQSQPPPKGTPKGVPAKSAK